jgi:predicted DNA-binding transcriptional regulator AlpA
MSSQTKSEKTKSATSQIRLMSKHEVVDVVGLSFPTIWAWMRDGKFPRSREVGGKTFWLASEIEQWIIDRPVRRLKGDPPDAKSPGTTKWSS